MFFPICHPRLKYIFDASLMSSLCFPSYHSKSSAQYGTHANTYQFKIKTEYVVSLSSLKPHKLSKLLKRLVKPIKDKGMNLVGINLNA